MGPGWRGFIGARLRDKGLRELARGAVVSGSMQAAEVVSKFALAFLLGRLLGASGTGLFYMAFTVTALGAVVGRCGLDGSLVRHIASAVAVGDFDVARGAVRNGIAIVLSVSSLMAFLVFGTAPWLAERVLGEPALTWPMQVMAISIPPLALLTVLASVLRALRQVFSSQLILSVMWPMAAAIAITLLGGTLSVVGAAWIQVGAMSLTGLVGFALLWSSSPLMRGFKGTFPLKVLVTSGGPLLIVTLLNTLLEWSPTIILGLFVPSADVGIFALAGRTAVLATFAVTAVNWLAAPTLAALYEQKEYKSLEATIHNSTILMLAFGGPLILILLTFSDTVMAVFGEDFRQGGDCLAILTVGGLISSICGPVGNVLIMTGNERMVLRMTLWSLTASWGLSFALSPLFGMIGMAIAVAVGIAVKNLLGACFVYRCLGIVTVPIRFLSVAVRRSDH